jgi:predicted DNA-binding transcriptional regulator YafY
MARTSSRRRPAVHITLGRAARLHRLVGLLAAGPRSREELLAGLGIGLRTFYRELELLKRCGVRVRLTKRAYALQTTAEEAEGRLPFPDPQLSFAEMAELARGPGDAARRLAELLASVTTHAVPAPRPRGRRKPR